MNYSGSFYPEKKDELLNYFQFFNKNRVNQYSKINPRAIIVPHAGYVYSGSVANEAYTLCKKHKYKRLIVVGPSHHCFFEGASICLNDLYETPLGDLEVDLKYSRKLIEKYSFLDFDENAHMEHSTETQMPFIKQNFHCKVIEIVYGKIDYENLSILFSELLESKDNLLIISSDLSHFHSQEKANLLDEFCIEGIKKQDLRKLDLCEACGIIGIKALVKVSKNLNLKTEFLDYKTSYEVTNDKSSVVGYCSFLIGE